MNQIPLLTSACRSCRHFTPEGRRGGTCQQLGVPVQASWKSCSLAVPAFASNWDSLKKLELWGTTILPEIIPLTEMKEVSLAEAKVLEALSA
jgi:hypothetical protein